MKKIFIVPGLGAKTDIYKYIKFPPEYQVVPVEWVEPQQQDTLPDYAAKLVEYYKIEPGHVLAGMSFGGIIINEISKIIEPEKMIFISTVKTHTELPIRYTIAQKVKIWNFLPYHLIIEPNKIQPYIPIRFVKKRLKLYEQYMSIRSKNYFKWSIREILQWRGHIPPYPYTHIHGTSDRIFPFSKLIGNIVPIPNGSHLIILTHPKQISKEINRFLIK